MDYKTISVKVAVVIALFFFIFLNEYSSFIFTLASLAFQGKCSLIRTLFCLVIALKCTRIDANDFPLTQEVFSTYLPSNVDLQSIYMWLFQMIEILTLTPKQNFIQLTMGHAHAFKNVLSPAEIPYLSRHCLLLLLIFNSIQMSLN